MSTTKHTAEPSSKPSPTPWKSDQWWNIHAANAVQVADVCVAKGPLHPSVASANAARIVACVNACAGMEDPARAIATLRTLVAKACACLNQPVQRTPLTDKSESELRGTVQVLRADAQAANDVLVEALRALGGAQ